MFLVIACPLQVFKSRTTNNFLAGSNKRKILCERSKKKTWSGQAI